MLAEYTARVLLESYAYGSYPTLRLTARVSGEVVRVDVLEEGWSWDEFTVVLTDYDPSCGGTP